MYPLIIKLHKPNSQELFLNVNQIVAWRGRELHNGDTGTGITTSEVEDFYLVQEEPEEIARLIRDQVASEKATDRLGAK